VLSAERPVLAYVTALLPLVTRNDVATRPGFSRTP
jgi:hypothetical protein